MMDKRVKVLYYLSLVDEWDKIRWSDEAESYWWNDLCCYVKIGDGVNTIEDGAIDYILGDLNETE